MPTSINWPSNLTQVINAISNSGGNYAEVPEQNIAEFQPEVGPPKRRRRSGVATIMYDCTMTLSPSAYDTLMTFYTTTLLDGTLTFNRNLPRDPTGSLGTFEFMFTSPPAYKAIDPLYADVAFQMRKMP
jgi:hypothetical protein